MVRKYMCKIWVVKLEQIELRQNLYKFSVFSNEDSKHLAK